MSKFAAIKLMPPKPPPHHFPLGKIDRGAATEQNQLRKELSSARAVGLATGIIGSLILIVAGFRSDLQVLFVGLGIFCAAITSLLAFSR